MKQSLQCSKCQSTRLWRIEKFRHLTDVLGGAQLVIAITDRDRIWSGSTITGTFDMFVCAKCGYSELWANDTNALRAKPEEGVHFIDGGVPGPYR